MRAAFTNLIEIVATCEDCGWTGSAGNAQGLASQHAERYGHLVEVTVTRYYIYAPSGRYRMRPTEAKARFSDGARS
ncbi:MAG: hypothetical protein ACJ79H_17570 [Myxococcales bacterium]